MTTVTPTAQQTHAAQELEKLNNPALNFVVDIGYLDAPSTETCQQCGNKPGICFIPDSWVNLTTVPDPRNPGHTYGVVQVCNPLCVTCCTIAIEASTEPDRVFSVDLATWEQR